MLYEVITYPTAPVPGSWTEFSSFVTAPAGVDRLFFEMYWNRTTLYLDDISIVEAAATPTATIAPLQLTNFSYTFGNGPSASKSVSLSAINLTGSPGNLTINGSTNYEVSADNISFGATASIPYASAVLAGTPVYVRLKQGLARITSYNVCYTKLLRFDVCCRQQCTSIGWKSCRKFFGSSCFNRYKFGYAASCKFR